MEENFTALPLIKRHTYMNADHFKNIIYSQLFKEIVEKENFRPTNFFENFNNDLERLEKTIRKTGVFLKRRLELELDKTYPAFFQEPDFTGIYLEQKNFNCQVRENEDNNKTLIIKW